MSIKIMSQVWENGPKSQSERFVLLALSDYANDEGECWPSIEGISRKTCLSVRGVQTVLRRLESAGWVSIDAGSGRRNCNVYTIKTPQHLHPAASAPPQMDAETPQMDAINPAASAPEPSLTINEPSEDTPCIPQAKKPDKARLPENWTPTVEDYEYAISQQLLDDEIKEIADDFHAYWADRTDAGGKKSARGWRQTWRNRIRDVAPKFKRNRGVAFSAQSGGYGQGRSVASVVAQRRIGNQT